MICPHCGGRGWTTTAYDLSCDRDTCTHCNGTGQIILRKSHLFQVPGPNDPNDPNDPHVCPTCGTDATKLRILADFVESLPIWEPGETDVQDDIRRWAANISQSQGPPK